MIKLDHIVVNVLRGMDAATELFTQLGFTLTPRGHHTLGSINHLMTTPGPYLELIGVPETGRQRQDLLDSPFGLNGLVFRSDDAEATYQGLLARGIAAPPPLSFSRPVAIEGREVDARFRTVRVPAERAPAGRVYFCQHLTPELVWRQEWLSHPNGFRGIDSIVIASLDPREDAELYASLGGEIGGTGAAGIEVRFDSFQARIVADARPRFLSVNLVFETLDEIEARATSLPSVTWARSGQATGLLTVPALLLTITCRSRS